MQLDNATITIRVRSQAELFDLGLHVLRAHVKKLLVLSLLCVAPVFLANQFLLDLMIPDLSWEDSQGWWFILNTMLILIEWPIVLAPLTIYLGQATFRLEASMREVFRDFFAGLPQLLTVQLVLRTLTLMIARILRPYATEVIMLERNRLVGGRQGAMTTRRRVVTLHQGWGGELFGRWLVTTGVGAMLVFILCYSISSTIRMFGGGELDVIPLLRFVIPTSVWITCMYLTVVRFLSYLDLRIRREGWEIELDMRAEALRLARQTI